MDDEGLSRVVDYHLSNGNTHNVSREQLCERYANLVYKIAQGIHRQLLSNVFLEDLIAFGQTGLLEAYQRFNGSYNVNFSTYAYYRIRGEILDACRRAGWGLKGKKSTDHLDIEEQVLLNEFLESEFLDPENPLHLPERTDYHECVNYLSDIVSDTAVLLMLRRAHREQAHEGPAQHRNLHIRQRNKLIREHIRMLDEPSQQILKLYYYKEYNMQKIADELQLSKSWVSRLHTRALKQLSKSLASVVDEL